MSDANCDWSYLIRLMRDKLMAMAEDFRASDKTVGCRVKATELEHAASLCNLLLEDNSPAGQAWAKDALCDFMKEHLLEWWW